MALGHAQSALSLFPARPEAFETAKEACSAAGREDEVASLVIRHVLAVTVLDGQDAGLVICRKETAGRDDWRLRILEPRFLIQKGSFREATEALETLRRDFPDEPRYAHELATLHLRLGHSDEAQELYEQLLSANPADTQAINGLFTLLVRKGDTESARALMARAEGALGPDRVRALLVNLALRENRPQEAIALARAEVAAKPESAAAHALLAELLWGSGELPGARAAYDKALALDPDFIPAHRRGLLDLQEGKTDEALTLFRQSFQRIKDHLAPRIHLAVALLVDGRKAEARALLEELSGGVERPARPLDAVRWVLAILNAADGDAEAALAENRLMVESDLGGREERGQVIKKIASAGEDPRRRAATALGLFTVFQRGGCFEAALQQAKALEELLPGEPMPTCWRLTILDSAGSHDEAVAGFETLIREHPKVIVARSLLAQSHIRHGDAQEAIQVLEQGVPSASPDEAASLDLQLGKLYEQEGRLDLARSHYEAAVSSRAFAPVAYNNLAWLLATEMNAPAEALPFAEQAVRLGGTVPQILDTLGWMHYLNDHAEKAVEYLEQARRAMPTHPTLRYHLGMAYLKAGRTAEAKKELQEALGISDEFPEAADAAKALSTL